MGDQRGVPPPARLQSLTVEHHHPLDSSKGAPYGSLVSLPYPRGSHL